MNKKLLVINAVGLTKSLIGNHSPFLQKFCDKGSNHFLSEPIPAVTCTSQANMLTGKTPSEHGIVGNGWYFKDIAKVMLWQQNFALIQQPEIWQKLKEQHTDFKVARMFWWFNMYSDADYSVTPRPIYRADGLKHPDAYSFPAHLNDELKQKLGEFPLFKFWGPATSIASSQWIADATEHVMEKHLPELSLTYLPHLDYNLQRLGPNDPKIKKDVKELDKVIAKLVAKAETLGYETIIVSEYGIQEVDTPIDINRELRRQHLLEVRDECGEDHFDAGASRAFAVADHQVAHVYVKNKSDIEHTKEILLKLEGVDKIYCLQERGEIGLDHDRAGDIVVLAKANAWFTYYYWLDDSRAPDFAPCVDIHRKPGYDPAELFMGKGGKFKAAKALLKKKTGMRYLMDAISLDPTLVKGSHGVPVASPEEGPLLLSSFETKEDGETLPMTSVAGIIENYFNG